MHCYMLYCLFYFVFVYCKLFFTSHDSQIVKYFYSSVGVMYDLIYFLLRLSKLITWTFIKNILFCVLNSTVFVVVCFFQNEKQFTHLTNLSFFNTLNENSLNKRNDFPENWKVQIITCGTPCQNFSVEWDG